jgi:hypothetical protein
MSAGRRIRALVLAVLAAGGCATVAEPPDRSAGAAAPRATAPGMVRNAGFEDNLLRGRACPPSWWCTMHSDTSSFAFEIASDARSNGRYLKVRRVKPEPWALVTQSFPAAGLSGKRLQLSVAVNTESLEGAGSAAGPVIILHGAGGRAVDRRETLVKRGPGWQRASTEIDVPAGIELVEIGLLLQGGGAAGFDDVETRAGAGQGS